MRQSVDRDVGMGGIHHSRLSLDPGHAPMHTNVMSWDISFWYILTR